MPDSSPAPLDPRAPVPYTPESYGAAGPVYLVKPATLIERAAFRAAVTGAAGPYPSDKALVAALRDVIAQLASSCDGGVDTEAATAVLDAYAAALAAQQDALRAGGDPAPVAEDLADAFEQLVAAAAKAAPGVRQILESRELRTLQSMIVACRMFCVGWSGDGLPRFTRTRAGVPPDLMDALPEADVYAVGGRALQLMAPTSAQRGNSASPRPSLSGPATSSTTPSPAPPATTGSSSAPATTATPPA